MAHSAAHDYQELVFNIRSLGLIDQPGEWKRITKTVPAPADLGIELARVPTGSDLSIDMRLESVIEGIFVTGTITTTAVCHDARTLEEFSLPLKVDIAELFVYRFDTEDDDSYRVVHDMIDVEPPARDAVVMALPFRPLKEPSDDEFSYTVGAADTEEDNTVDPRWLALQTVFNSTKEN